MRSIDQLSPQERKKAHDLLTRLLPLARQQADVFERAKSSNVTLSPLMSGLRPYMRVDNVAGVRIVQNDDLTWSTEVAFAEVPEGMPDVVGTPAACPCRTREDAERSAILLLATLIHMERRPDVVEGWNIPPNRRVFDLCGLLFELPEDMIADFRRMPELDALLEEMDPSERLLSMIEEDWPDEDTEFDFEALPPGRKARYLALMLVLLSRNVYRLRRRQTRAEGSTTVH